jgi:SAM-dependent methyltransferase
MSTLARRPRARRLQRILAGLGQGLLAAAAARAPQPPTATALGGAAAAAEREGGVEPQTEMPSAEDFARSRPRTWLASEGFMTTRRLYERLNDSDTGEIEQLIAEAPDLSAHFRRVPDPLARQQLILAYGVWLGHRAATEKTGLAAVEPPADVHVMARGPLAAAGGLYEADIVADALMSVGVDIATLTAALDFGCSSGRVLRVLRAAYPSVEWRGCDPNEAAITWASQNLPGISFFASADAPPIEVANTSLDLVYAISIWSHFEPELGLRWFEEMHRLIRPGGHLVCTTHGLTSIAHYALAGMRTPQQSREIADALYRRGSWYAAEFGEEGDWGVVNPSWGTAFLSPEWMLTQLCPRWRVLEFAPGRNQDNQDVYVLERV